ncbi:MAG: hypothetical protein MK108_03545 [Mariniblastus sp.]|nr:hypothetical protein [Mariniblastus sp.]
MIRFTLQNFYSALTAWAVRGSLALLLSGCLASLASAQEGENEVLPAPRPGHLIRVPLPITSEVASSIERTLGQLLEESDNVVRNEDRPTVVLEFDTANNKTGRGSQLGSCLELARKMTSNEMNRLRTVAFIPPASGAQFLDDFETEKPKSDLMGHAVLVALAANELVVADQASIGQATVDEPKVTNLIREVYREVAARRLTLPVPVVDAMVDAEAELYRVNTDNGIVYADAKQLAELEAEGDVIGANTLSAAGQLARLEGNELDRFGLTQVTAGNLRELAFAFQVKPESLENDPSLGQDWKAVQLRISNNVDPEFADWSIRAMDRMLAEQSANLLIIRIDADQADVETCMRLARHLAGLDSRQVRTVAYVEGAAKGGAGVIAATCDHLLMQPETKLGGNFEPPLEDPFREDYMAMADQLAVEQEKEGAVVMAMIDPNLDVLRFRQVQTGRVSLMTPDQHAALPRPEDWSLLGPLDVLDGIPATQAEQLGIARWVAGDFDQLKTYYQLVEDPRSIEPTPTDRWVKRLASWLASPFITPWLIFGAVFFLSTEFSAPGIGVPGFLGTLCLVAFFWSQSLDGNADWLEILLFFTGVIFILMEMFVIPGFGIFGLGGILMVMVSLILASQSFVIPVNAEEVRHMAYSCLTLLGACAGLGVALFVLQKVLPHAPLLRQIILKPPRKDALSIEAQGDPEAVVNWQHLAGRTGETVTKLFPAGKAKIDGRLYDVISDGQLIDSGVKIRVIEVMGNRIQVEVADQDA